MLRRKTSRRSSTQYYISAEEHVDNEVKHERLFTETSRLSSSWANLSVSGAESECSSSNSTHTSPTHRPNSFSGPLVISVTCSSSSCSATPNFCSLPSNNGRTTPTSPCPTSVFSAHTSPVASPISSRVQSFSPGLLSSPNHRRSQPGNASPLLLSTSLSRKRSYFSTVLSSGCSSDDASREGSPDPQPARGNKITRHSDCRLPLNGDIFPLRWPPGPTQASNPPSPSCHLFPFIGWNGTTPSSPSTSSLPSPRNSVTSGTLHFPGSPVISAANNSISSDDSKLDSKTTHTNVVPTATTTTTTTTTSVDANTFPVISDTMEVESKYAPRHPPEDPKLA